MYLFTVQVRHVAAPYSILPGIRLHQKPFPHINGGTGGAKIPLHADFAATLSNEPETRLISGANICSLPGESLLPSVSHLLLTEAVEGDRRALVRLIVTEGNLLVDGGNLIVRPCPERGKDVSRFYRCPRCGARATRRGSSSYLFSFFDEMFPHWCHYSHEGYVKSWQGLRTLAYGEVRRSFGFSRQREYLMVLEPGQCIRFHVEKGWFGPAVERFLHWDGMKLKEGSFETIFPPGEVSLTDARPI